jgi:predicted ABC-type ATPase
MDELSSIMYIFAGNNGSGKSTIRNLIVDRLGISVNIDPDALARGIDSVHPESRKVSAGKEAIKLARDCIRNGRDFSIETTLAGGNAIRLIPSEEIIRRHHTSVQLIDHLIVIDNSHTEGEIVLGADNSSITYRSDSLPQWVECIEQRLMTM